MTDHIGEANKMVAGGTGAVPCNGLLDGLTWDWPEYSRTDPVVHQCLKLAIMQSMTQVQWLEFLAMQLMTAKLQVEREYRRLLKMTTKANEAV